ncbi:MAG TPA: hypothetical protein VHX88_07480 [Solirubrobacteraceae bacterium]|jgi:hypothetical protein|nr:hypothetical protein [Solirubrobacteraceae bacterium]
MSGDIVESPSSVYVVFARLHPTDPLAELGTLRASNDGLACAYARTTYDEDHWCEMAVVPRAALIPVIETRTRP